MNMVKRILVTGADGFIGKYIVDDLQSGYQIHTYSRRNSPYTFHHQGDICDIDKLDQSFDVVIHAAGNKTDVSSMHRVNVEGMESVVRYVQKSNAKLIVIGSAGVYGIYRNDDNVITTKSKLFPDTAYEKSKAAAQVIVEQAGLASNSFIILQPTNVIGEGDQSRKLLHLFKILQKDNFYYLNRNAQVNYVYARKVAGVVREIVDRSYFPNQSFIINDPMRIEDFIRISADALGLRSPSKSIPAILQPLLYLLARCSIFLPDSLSHFSMGRYYELTSERYYSAIETDNQFPSMEKTDIRSGINNLVEYYRCNKWL
ncbi:MAG: hypothetical protein RLZZ543_1282 [Bacteroidota bacterium]